MEFTGGFRQSTSSLQEAIPRDISQATALAGRKGAATFDADSRGAPNCFVRAGRELVRNVSGGGKGGTKIQTSPPKRISPPTRTAERLQIPRHVGPGFHVMPGRHSTASRATLPR